MGYRGIENMQYNTAKNSLVTTNGNVTLSGDQISALLEVSEVSIETMTANSGTGTYDKLIVDIDLGVRLHTSEIKYYFDSDVSSSAVASGISFQYKNEAFQNYTSLPIYIDQEYYYTNTSGVLFAPRYFKLIHELSETDGFLTTLSGYVTGGLYGLEVLNDDTYVDFGVEGTTTGDIVTAVREGAADIRAIQIYNSGLLKSTAYVSLDPTYTDLDSVMAVSISENGPWVFPLDENLVIMRAGEDDEYGSYNNTELVDGVIKLVGYSDAYDNTAISVENGSYTTKVFSSDITTWNSIIVDRVLPLNGSLQVDSDDGTETIEVRNSNSKPKSYNIYREFHVVTISTTDYLRYRDKWVETDEIKTTSIVNLLSATHYTEWRDFFIVIDPVTERWGGFVYHYTNTSNITAQWYLLNVSSSDSVSSKLMAQQSTTATVMTFDWKNLKFDYEGGVWIYFYAASYRDSDFVEETGYYLCYLDSSLTEKFKYFKSADFVGAMDVHYDTKHLWYTLPASYQIQKIDFDGTVLHNHFENSDILGGLCVLPDGDVWYANYKDLHKLRSTGAIIDEIQDVADDLFLQIAPDGDGTEALWALENFYVSRLIISGENKGIKEFSVYVNYALRLYPVNSGVWVWCADAENPGDTYMRHVSKVNRRIDKEYKTSYVSIYGLLEYTHEDEQYTSKMPLSVDQVWSNLEWEKVNTESYILPEDNYHQVRVTLRRQTPYQKYGDNVNMDDIFHTDDDFNQVDDSPNHLLWGGYLGNGRVYVEDNQLVLTNDPDPTGGTNAYIRTKDRYVLTGNFDVQFDYIMGDGTQTDKYESVYLYAYATDNGVWGQYLRTYIYIHMNSPFNGYIYISMNDGATSSVYLPSYDRWTGKLRLRRSDDRIYGYVWDPQTSSWKGNYRSGVNPLGNYFYLLIQADRNGSNVYVDNFTVTAGTAYYYTDTPKVEGIYTRKEVEVEDIYPNTSKGVYLRSYISQGLDVESHYDTTLRARWRTPVE